MNVIRYDEIDLGHDMQETRIAMNGPESIL